MQNCTGQPLYSPPFYINNKAHIWPGLSHSYEGGSPLHSEAPGGSMWRISVSKKTTQLRANLKLVLTSLVSLPTPFRTQRNGLIFFCLSELIKIAIKFSCKEKEVQTVY